MKSGTSAKQSTKLPVYAGKLGYSDMTGFDADGKPQSGFNDRSSKPQQADPKALYQMPLTKEEQAIMDGKKGGGTGQSYENCRCSWQCLRSRKTRRSRRRATQLPVHRAGLLVADN